MNIHIFEIKITFVLFEVFHNFQLEEYQMYIDNPYELDILMLILKPYFF